MAIKTYDPVRTTKPDGTNLGFTPKVAKSTPDGLIPMVAPAPSHDLILDQARGTSKSVSASTTLITPPSIDAEDPYDCEYMWLYSLTADIFWRADDVAAAVPIDGLTGVSNGIPAGLPGQGISVTPGVPVRVISATGVATIVVATPAKPRE